MVKKRRLIQLYAALLYNAYLKGFAKGKIYTGRTKTLCVPGLNCYSCPGALASCPLGALQNALAASGHRAGFYVIGILMLFGLTLGRTVCGWLCPFGLVQELLGMVPFPKLKKSGFTRKLSYLKYFILAVFVIGLPLAYGLAEGISVPGFCKYICPAGTLEGALPLLLHPGNKNLARLMGGLFSWKAAILAVIVISCLFVFRPFCMFLCPLGALYGMFSRIALAGVKTDKEKCTGCGACVRCCPMDTRCAGDHECIHCGRCIPVCPEQAISYKNAGFLRKKKARRITAAAVCLLLVFALVWFNMGTV